ncbi:MAG: DNA-3-methyladenine glycosylase [Anaerolineales bacterium]|nr:DNA-3-methyladenine glycosylase [Anaerolineales bacterium]
MAISIDSVLPRDFYLQPTLKVARDLLGMRLMRLLDGHLLAGIILETEAYIGQEDLGCHARSGRTPRNAVMFGPPGHAYVYFTYGMHWCLNAVTEAEGFAAAVLIRAIEPIEGVEIIRARRNGRDTFGPAKVTKALGIDGSLNGADLCNPASGLWIERGQAIPEEAVLTGPRIGLNHVPEPWKSIPWRFRVKVR